MSLRRVIEHSVAATVTEEAMEVRGGQVKQLRPAHIRLAVQSIDAAVFMIPSLKFSAERAKMRRSGLRLIGSGAEARVYSNGESVLKYVLGSEYLDDEQRKGLGEKKQREFDQLYDSMAPFVLDQTIAVAPHIAKPGRQVVQTEQAYTPFSPLVERNGNEGAVNLHSAPTPVVDTLSNFVDASWNLYGRTGLLPDTNGVNNIVQHENQLILIDTQPIALDNEPIQELIRKQLGAIAAELEAIS